MGDRIGFIGLGTMGKPMARNLLAAGFSLTVHSRSAPPVDEMVKLGAADAASSADVAARSDVVITMLPEAEDVEQVLLGARGVVDGAAHGLLAIDMSTIDPGAARRIAATLGERDVHMLDAPVSGGERGTVEATLSIMAGGDPADFDRALPLFEAMGKTIVHVGPIGAGQVAKACNQLVVGATIEAVAEALLLAHRAGADPGKVREALLGSSHARGSSRSTASGCYRGASKLASELACTKKTPGSCSTSRTTWRHPFPPSRWWPASSTSSSETAGATSTTPRFTER